VNVFELFAKIGVDTSDYDKGLDDASEKTSSFGSKVSSALKVATTAVATASTAVVGIAKTSVETGATFDSSMAQVAATMGTTVDNIQNLRDFALEMGSTTAFSASQAADALNYMALAGYDADESMAALPNVLNLAASGGIDLATASDMVTDAQSALGLTMDESTELVNKMAAAASSSNTSVSQLGDAILTIGGTAKDLAGGTTELSTALGILADNGIKGAEGGTHLRNIMLSLESPTDTAAAALADLGVEVFDAEGNMRSLEDIFGDLNTAMDGMTTAEKTNLISTVFNKTDIASANALLATSTDRWEELSEAIENSAGAAEAMAGTQLDNLNGDVTLFQSALEGAEILISDQLTPTLRGFVQFGSSAISTLSEAFQEGGLSGAMDALGGILTDGIQMVVEMVPKVVEVGSQLLGALLQGIINNLPTIVTGAMQIITTLATGLTSFIPTIIPTIISILTQITQTLTDNLPLLVQSALEIVTTLGDSIKNDLPLLVEAAFNIITTILNGIIDNVGELLPAIAEVMVELSTDIIEMLPDLVPTIIEIVMQITTTIIENVDLLLEAVLEVILTLADGIVDNLPTIATSAVKIMATLISGIAKKIPELLTSAASIIAKLTAGLLGHFPELLQKGKDAVSKIIDGIKAKLSDVTQKGKDIIDAVKNGVMGKIEAAKDWGKDLISNFVSGITEKWQKLKSTVSNVAQTVKNFLGFSEPEEGPLSNFHTYAPDMMELFAKGIADNEDIVTDQITKSFDFGKIGVDVGSIDFGTANVDFASSGLGMQQASVKSMVSNAIDNTNGNNFTIVVQSVLDGTIIGETAYDFIKGKQRALGVT
jgi:TP901 family phage tail tape measure protein